ncbi:hypothetical protein KEJ13_09295 [Candidatus Bathyarchaeota archaeon]|nr:hypothetical protein [Candidatus Bathyarchaeota archaeon]
MTVKGLRLPSHLDRRHCICPARKKRAPINEYSEAAWYNGIYGVGGS